ncbi:hypothetical protein VPG91_11600 [Nitrospirillum amazonense]|uniref:hypothetical protein n=1 Tax=Nitrospirillum amazonense TaxID=28077 RepID=UPI002DD434A2|nr:hypothetical protein [Nitrospirillum amazonense]MEC4591634.1 hypothetical protein [Nitrospirillum amazonense]
MHEHPTHEIAPGIDHEAVALGRSTGRVAKQIVKDRRAAVIAELQRQVAAQREKAAAQ